MYVFRYEVQTSANATAGDVKSLVALAANTTTDKIEDTYALAYPAHGWHVALHAAADASLSAAVGLLETLLPPPGSYITLTGIALKTDAALPALGAVATVIDALHNCAAKCDNNYKTHDAARYLRRAVEALHLRAL